jgi:RNA polymerase sigma-70 factor (sigma-E family)
MLEDGERAYRDFVAARIAPLRRVAYLMCGDWHRAEDAVASALARLYIAWPRVRDERRVEAYARTMVVRAVIDEHRRPWRRERVRYDEEAVLAATSLDRAASADPTSAVADRIVLRQALSQLPSRRRAVLVLRFYAGLSVEETAEALGCTTGTVKSQTARALATLRDLLPSEYLITYGAHDD